MSQNQSPPRSTDPLYVSQASTGLTDVESELRQRAFLHNDPDAYRAGVRDALREVAATPPAESDGAPELG